MLWTLGRYLLPILGLLCLAGVAVECAANRLPVPAPKASIDLGRLDPLAGLRRLFSAKSIVHLTFGVFKLAAVLAVGGAALYNQREALLGLSALAPPALVGQVTQVLLWTALEVGAALLILAILDYAYQAVAARTRPQDDAAGTARGIEEPRRQSPVDCPAKTSAARSGATAAPAAVRPHAGRELLIAGSSIVMTTRFASCAFTSNLYSPVPAKGKRRP